MSLFNRKEADEQYDNATSTLRIAKRDYENSGSPDQIEASQCHAVNEWLSATQDRIISHQYRLLELTHNARTLSDTESRGLNAMLTEIAMEFFPDPGRTLFDDGHSLLVRVTGLHANSSRLLQFYSELTELRREVAILAEWYDWRHAGEIQDPSAMLNTIRQKHDLTARIAFRLDKVAVAFGDLRDEAIRERKTKQ